MGGGRDRWTQNRRDKFGVINGYKLGGTNGRQNGKDKWTTQWGGDKMTKEWEG